MNRTVTAATIPLLIAGAGGLGRETLEAVRAGNAVSPRWAIAGFIDDAESLQGSTVGGAPVVGGIDEALRRRDHLVVVTTGRPDAYFTRRRIVHRLALPTSRWATIIHPLTALAESVRIGPGCIVLAGTVATTDVTVGAHVALMPHVVLTHDVVIEDYATIASGVRLSGGVRVGEGAYIGAGATVREGCRVGAWALVGMGSVVLRDIPAGEVWAGNPARRLRAITLPGDVRGAA